MSVYRQAALCPFTNRCCYKSKILYSLQCEKAADVSRKRPCGSAGVPAFGAPRGGYQLDRAQDGEAPTDWKMMATVGHGVQEMRIRDEAGAFRVIYIAKFSDFIYVLHCFQKKTQRTAKSDLDVAVQRYRALVKELGS